MGEPIEYGESAAQWKAAIYEAAIENRRQLIRGAFDLERGETVLSVG